MSRSGPQGHGVTGSPKGLRRRSCPCFRRSIGRQRAEQLDGNPTIQWDSNHSQDRKGRSGRQDHRAQTSEEQRSNSMSGGHPSDVAAAVVVPVAQAVPVQQQQQQQQQQHATSRQSSSRLGSSRHGELGRGRGRGCTMVAAHPAACACWVPLRAGRVFGPEWSSSAPLSGPFRLAA